MRFPVTITTALTFLVITGAPRLVRADVEGRVSAYNLAAHMADPESMADALYLRAWLVTDRIADKKISFHLDLRSEFDFIRAAGNFNAYCDGNISEDPACQNRIQRHTVLGDLDRIAGIYDAFFNFEELGSTWDLSVGRKTIYEAGLVTVDGFDLQHKFKNAYWGAFAGLGPHPLTGLPDSQYQALGSYWGYKSRHALFRVAGAAQLFDLKPDVAYLYTQDFIQLKKGLTLSIIGQFDFVPFVADRMAIINLNFRTSPKYRLRLSINRFRSQAFKENPLFRENLLATNTSTTLPDGLIPTTTTLTKASTYHQARIIGQVETYQDITAFMTVGVKQRTFDEKIAPVASIGARSYHPIKLPVQGMVRYQYSAGFDSEDHQIGVALEHKPSIVSPFTFGGTADHIFSRNLQITGPNNPNIGSRSGLSIASAFIRYDKARYVLYAEYEASLPSKATEAENKAAAQHLLIFGYTQRFGSGAKPLF